jgi:hypothetical protein
MKNANFRRTLVGAAVATALSVSVDSADAGQWKGTFDPTNFAGEYIVTIDQACIDQGTGWYGNDGICSVTLTSAFANVSDDPDFNSPPSLIFAPPDYFGLFGVYVYGGKIDSIDSGLIHQVSPTSPGGIDDWWLQFVSGHNPSDCGYPNFCTEATDLSRGVYLYKGDPNTPVASADFIGQAELIPEPGTLSLVLGALGGGWLARRRRKEKVPDPN